MTSAVPPITPADVLAGLAIIAFVWIACRIVWPPLPKKEHDRMSVRIANPSGVIRHRAAGFISRRYEVRWRDLTGSNRSRTFTTQADAEQFDRAVRAWVDKRRADEAWDSIPRDLRQQVAVLA